MNRYQRLLCCNLHGRLKYQMHTFLVLVILQSDTKWQNWQRQSKSLSKGPLLFKLLVTLKTDLRNNLLICLRDLYSFSSLWLLYVNYKNIYPFSSNKCNGGSTSSIGFNCLAFFSSLLICFSNFFRLLSSRALTIAGSIFFFFFMGSAL